MSKQFLDKSGVSYFWSKIKTWATDQFVAKETGKGLSTNDYTTAEKTKLEGIAEGANKTTVTNSLTSTSATEALAAAQGKALDEKISGLATEVDKLGVGDMLKSEYDTNGNGIVDNAEDAAKLGGQLPAYYAKASDIPTVTNDYTNAEKEKVTAAYEHSQAAHAPSNAQENVIESVSVNGTDVPVDGKAVDITVPTKVSQLTNDSGYITEHIDISGKADKATTLAGYGIGDAYTKGETDSAIATAVANADHLKRTIVESLPTTGDENTIYMMLEDNASGDNKYIEWMYINGAWEKTGDTDVDLTDYMKTADLVAITDAEIDAIIAA